MVKLGITDEDKYAQIPVKTRARMIAAQEGKKMISHLDQHRAMEMAKARTKSV